MIKMNNSNTHTHILATENCLPKLTTEVIKSEKNSECILKQIQYTYIGLTINSRNNLLISYNK